MDLSHQIILGSLFLMACLLVEILLLAWCTILLRRMSARITAMSLFLRAGVPTGLALCLIVAAHTIQVWVWAGALVLVDALETWNAALYFSLASYTTLGYGDIVLGEGLRIFAAFSAVAGLLAFGLSTAFLVALMSRVLETSILRNGSADS